MPGQEVVRRGMPQGTPGAAQPGRVAGTLGGVGVVFQAGATGEGLIVASLANDGPAGQSGQVRAARDDTAKPSWGLLVPGRASRGCAWWAAGRC